MSVRRSWADIVKGETSCAQMPTEPLPQAEVHSASEIATPSSVLVASSDCCEERAASEADSEMKQAETPQLALTAAVAVLQPSTKGSLRCFCRGQVLSMLSHYGWLKAFGLIDHPMFEKHFGRIYVQKSDVVEGHTLEVGDVVSFYLYEDHLGLGAELCQVETQAAEVTVQVPCTLPAMGKSASLRIGAAEFVPESESINPTESNVPPGLYRLRAEAVEFVPAESGIDAMPSLTVSSLYFSSVNAVTDMSAPKLQAADSVTAGACIDVVGINLAFFDSSSEDGDDESIQADTDSLPVGRVSALRDDHLELNQSAKVRRLRQAAPWRKVGNATVPSAVESDGMASDTTATGASSDSESESKILPRAPPGLLRACKPTLPAFRPPPGLSLPESPPGLGLPERPPGIFFAPGLKDRSL